MLAGNHITRSIVPTFLRDRDGHVETWTINLPEQRNPITDDEVVQHIVDAVADVNADTSVHAVIITGAGSAFSAGGNVNDIRDGKGYFGADPYPRSEGYRHGIQRIPKSLWACEVPLIAAVNGPAVGAGCDLALMCDIRVASTKAFFAESFVKLGLVPGDGGAWFLPRVIGYARAAEMTLTGGRVDAAKALDWGLVSQVVEPDELLATARALADEISANPVHATRMAKRLLQESHRQNLDTLLDMSGAYQSIAHSTSDHIEAINAAIDKRTPVFTGK